MAAEDNDHTARLSSLTSALRSVERPRSEPDRASDPANLPLIRDPLPPLELFASEQPVTLFASEQPVTEPPAVDSVLRRLSASVQANRRLLGGVCVALVLVVGVGAGVRRLWPRVRASMSSAPAPVATAPTEAAPADAAPADAAPATAVPVEAPPGSTTAAASTAHDVLLPPDTGRRRRPQSVAAAPSPVDAPAPATATSLESELSAATGPVFVSPVAPGSSSPAKEANVTFGPGDAEVIPPRVIDAQTIIKLRPVTPGIRHDALIIAVVVNEQGLVESARAVMPPRDLGESVILMGALSSAKSWRFRPATRSGRPVKFRQTFELAEAPER